MAKTKLVRIQLAALTRVEYSEVIEVPDNMTNEELERLVDKRYDEVDGGLYADDPHYWERGESCGFQVVEQEEVGDVTARLRRKRGDFVLSDIRRS